MAKVSLRAYNTEIDHLIDNNQLDEAIAHCIHILGIYPKHVDTYRLLGKAFLERQRYNDAADMFLRVLAIFPDDFVAHIGISIVREELSDLNLAVFHMERAFEVQPTNTAIQDELKRLYGKRDGVAPAKIRLTHPALARLYSKGDLNQQALGELSVAIADTPSRADILAQLAELYTREGQNNEAVETCNKLIEQLPYCYGALNVLTRLLPGTPFAQDAPIYQARIIELDPYFEFKSNINEAVSDVQEEAIMIEPLVWSPNSELTVNKSDWINSLGLKLVEAAQVDPALFQRKAPVASYTQDETPTVPRIRQTSVPFSPPAASDITPPAIQSNSEPTPPADLPEWMQTAGWSKSDDPEGISGVSGHAEGTPTMPSIEKIQRDTDHLPPLPRDTNHLPPLPDDGTGTRTGDTGALEPAKTIEPGSIPDWVRSIAPPDLTTPAPEAASGAEGISEKSIDDAFSSIFPSLQPQVSSQPEMGETTSFEDLGEPVRVIPMPEVPTGSFENIPAPKMDEENVFSLDDLRKEMDMVADLPSNAEPTASSDDLLAESMDNGSALDNLRKSFHTEEPRLGGDTMPEDKIIEKNPESPQVPPEAIRPSQEVKPEEVMTPPATLDVPIVASQEEPTIEEVNLPQEPEQPVSETTPETGSETISEPVKATEVDIPVWLRNLGDTQTPADGQQAEAAQEELPAWLQDFEQKIEEQPASTAEPTTTGPEQVVTPSELVEQTDWRQNLPPKSESKFHTQELPEIPGLDLTETPDQYEVEKSVTIEQPAPEITPEPTPTQVPFEKKEPDQVFSGGETTIIAPPISKVTPEEDERPAWLSKLIGIDDVETPAAVKPAKSSPSEATSTEKPESMDDIAGSMQAAWMLDLLSDKKPEVQTPPPSPLPPVATPEPDAQKEAALEPEPSSEEAQPQEVLPPSVESGISDIDKMFEGIQIESELPTTEPIPVGPESVLAEMPTVPESPTQGDSDLSKLIGTLQSEPSIVPDEPEPSVPVPAATAEAPADERSDFVKMLDDLQGEAVPPAVEQTPVMPAAEVVPGPKSNDFGEIPDLIKMVDDLRAEPEQTPATPLPSEPTRHPTPAAAPVVESVDTDGVPDLNLIVEGLQAAWMSEHVDDGEVKHTGKLHDIYVPPSETDGNETIVFRRSGPSLVESQPESSQPVAVPPVIEPEPIPPVAEAEPIDAVIESAPESVITPVSEPIEEQVIIQSKTPHKVIVSEKPVAPVAKAVAQPFSPPASKAPAVASTPAEEILQDARAAFSHGVLDESLDRYLELITRNRLIESVIEDLVSMTAVQGDQSDIWQALGDAYTRRNHLDQALSAYLKAEELLK
jgi:tetratricopeptide (TPR) repeat protein